MITKSELSSNSIRQENLNKSITKAAIYSRKSRFTATGESIENQINLCKEYAKNYNVKDFYIYEDEGFSGGNLDRPEFKKMIKDARLKKFNMILCYRLDRISRNIADFSNLMNELEELSISFVSLREQFDTSTPMGRAMMYITSVFAQLERETIAERVKDNMLEMAKTGRWLGGQTPLGFKSEAFNYIDTELKERKMHRLYPIENELDNVKIIYETYLNTNSLNKAVKYLYSKGIKSKQGTDFTVKKIQSILRSPIYVKSSSEVIEYLENQGIKVAGKANGCGIITYNKTKNLRIKREKSEWIAAVANHKGIIEASKWLQVQYILDENKIKSPRLGKTNDACLTGLLKCSLCGSPMYIKHGHKSKKNGKIIQYYVCSLKMQSQGSLCSNPNIRKDLLENIVFKNLKFLDFNSELLKNILKYNINNYEFEDDEYTLIKKNIENKKKQIENLVNQLSMEPSLNKYIVPKIETIETEISKLENKLSNLAMSEKSKDNTTINFMECAKDFEKLINYVSIDYKKLILTNIIDSIYYDGENGRLDINFKSEL